MRARRFCTQAAPSRTPKSLHVRLGPAKHDGKQLRYARQRMGFRASRVQIPTSRLSEEQALQPLRLWGFFFVVPLTPLYVQQAVA